MQVDILPCSCRDAHHERRTPRLARCRQTRHTSMRATLPMRVKSPCAPGRITHPPLPRPPPSPPTSSKAKRFTTVSCVTLLLVVSVSTTLLATLAILLRKPTWVGVTLMVTVTIAPLGIVPTVQVTIQLASTQLPLVLVTVRNVTPDGSVTVSVNHVPTSVPCLVTIQVKVRVWTTLTAYG